MLYDLSKKVFVVDYVPPVIDKRKKYKILLQDDFQIESVYLNLIHRGYFDTFHISSVRWVGKPVAFFLFIYENRPTFANIIDPSDFNEGYVDYEEIDWFKLVKDGVNSV